MCLITTFYKKQQSDFLRTAAISAASYGSGQVDKYINDFQASLFPWIEDERRRKEELKAKFLESESKKTYRVKVIEDPAEISKRKRIWAYQSVGIKEK